MSWLDQFLASGFTTIEIAGVPLPAEQALNFVSGATGVNNAPNGSVDITIVPPAGNIVNPTVQGTVTFLPTTTSPLTYAAMLSYELTGQTTSSSYSDVTLATVALPGTTGAVCARGQLDLEYDVSIVQTTAAVGARFKGALSYAVQASGTVVTYGTDPQPVAIGSNSGAPPSSWAVALTLDGSSLNVLIQGTTDSSHTYNVHVSVQAKYSN
jgi:hypothetical protein